MNKDNTHLSLLIFCGKFWRGLLSKFTTVRQKRSKRRKKILISLSLSFVASSEEAFFPNFWLSDKRAPSEEIVSLSLIQRTSSQYFSWEIDSPAALEIPSFFSVHELSYREEASCFANFSFVSFLEDIDLGFGDGDLGFSVMEVCPPEGEC